MAVAVGRCSLHRSVQIESRREISRALARFSEILHGDDDNVTKERSDGHLKHQLPIEFLFSDFFWERVLDPINGSHDKPDNEAPDHNRTGELTNDFGPVIAESHSVGWCSLSDSKGVDRHCEAQEI